ncbi:hypothetical protein RN001_003918 [Aquatica leii]|uniref:Uncharacterized protein n=1 Tax=Aquatica leii TaxID=1421715 RepID=A0AAN7Q9Z9_9COLE|nr:hypothetical protein RN001_003918 [Aquatica leii]
MARGWYDTQEQLTTSRNTIKKNLITQFSKPLPVGKLLREAVLKTALCDNAFVILILYKDMVSQLKLTRR